MARRLIPQPDRLSKAAALTGKLVIIYLTGSGNTIRMKTEFTPEEADYYVIINGEVTGYHLTRSLVGNTFELSIAGWGPVDVSSPGTRIYRVIPSWWRRALIWLGLMDRPYWY